MHSYRPIAEISASVPVLFGLGASLDAETLRVLLAGPMLAEGLRIGFELVLTPDEPYSILIW